MTILRTPHPFDRDEFVTPFDKLFDVMMEKNFPEVAQTVGVSRKLMLK